MKKILFLLVFSISLSIPASAQKIAKPTLIPKPPTDAQKQLIQEGVALHDAKRYDEAIEKYQKVLDENPDCSAAIYELANTLYTKRDTKKAMEMAYRGSKYKAEELPLFYNIMASIIDDVGKPEDAVKIYLDAIKALGGDKEFVTYLSSLHYNLGVTYVRLKRYPDSRASLKKAVEYDFRYPSPHYLLAAVYNGTKYRVPAMLAAARFISLEFNSDRTRSSAAIFRNGLRPPSKDEKGNIQIFVNPDSPTDEGEFMMYDLLLGTLTVGKDDKDKNKTEAEIFVDAVDTFISLLAEDKKLASTFVGKNYVPFLAELKSKGFVKPFAYLVLYQTGDSAGMKWLTENDAQLTSFIKWAKAY